MADNNTSGGRAPASNQRMRRVAVSGLETDEAVDLAIEVDQALKDVDRAITRGSMSRDEGRKMIDEIYEYLRNTRNGFNTKFRQPLRKAANTQRRRKRRAQGQEQSVKGGQVQGAAAGEAQQQSGQTDEASAGADEVSAAVAGGS